jgi:hypothetical protein
MKQSLMTLVCIEPKAIPLNKSGVTTSPRDGVTVILIEYQTFLVYRLNILFFTSFYTSRIRFPAAANMFRAILLSKGLISSGGASHTKQPLLILSI